MQNYAKMLVFSISIRAISKTLRTFYCFFNFTFLPNISTSKRSALRAFISTMKSQLTRGVGPRSIAKDRKNKKLIFIGPPRRAGCFNNISREAV